MGFPDKRIPDSYLRDSINHNIEGLFSEGYTVSFIEDKSQVEQETESVFTDMDGRDSQVENTNYQKNFYEELSYDRLSNITESLVGSDDEGESIYSDSFLKELESQQDRESK